MEIRDAVHGIVTIDPSELSVLESRHFQRLRQIKQLGFAENSFPGAVHNRYTHSLGAMNTATHVFDQIFKTSARENDLALPASTLAKWRAALRLAALLHDVGHGPLSHTTEFAMPEVKLLNLPSCLSTKSKNRKATHEDYTLKMILDSELTPILEKVGELHGFKPIHIAGLIDSRLDIQDHFFRESHPQINFRPLLRQIISSELDADRMDYLRRDSLYAGVSYGQFDFNWLVGNLTLHFDSGNCYLCLEHRALYAFEDFLISRFHMFLMVYFHHKSVIFDEMLAQYFASPECDYFLPADIEKYCDHNDAFLYNHLARSKNHWAQRIIQKRPYQVLIELHSGIPATQIARTEQKKLLSQIETNLESQKIQSLLVTSTSELSKYFRKPGDPIFVRYDNHYSASSYIRLEQCTDLFQKYGEKRSISRLYVSPEDYPICRHQGKDLPLRYEEELST